MADLLPPRSPTDLFGGSGDSQPLWFKKSSFSHPNFDSESYISDLRSFVPLETLRSELRSHLSSLKHELLDLINRDYADFVDLSTKLVDVDSAVSRMRAPLLELREKIAQFRGSVESSLAALNNGLKQRVSASATRETLELLLDTFHVVSKIEKLIKELPSVPADLSGTDGASTGRELVNNGSSSQLAENATNLRETQSMLLERIASEMNWLKFYIAHGEVFAHHHHHHHHHHHTPYPTYLGSVAWIIYCICSYRNQNVQSLPFIANMESRIKIASLVLDGSLHHCFVASLEHRDMSSIYNCLRAYAAIDNTTGAEEIFREALVSPAVQQVITGSSLHVPVETSVDALEKDYQKIMEFVDRDCKFVLEISSSANSGLHVFDFLANSILKEVLVAIQKGKPGALSPGKPSLFLRNYKASLDFLAYLEGHCPFRSAVSKFRSEAVYSEFMKQWNIGVYFSLRFQEIAGTLDSALMASHLSPIPNLQSISKEGAAELTLKQSVALLDSLKSCWREDVLLLSCSDKFLRLTLQLLSRYSTWLSSGLAARKAGSAGVSPSFEWAISASPEDFIYIMHDIDCLTAELKGDYLNHVLALLASCPHDVQDVVKHSIIQGGMCVKDVAPTIMDTMIDALVEKSVEDLRQLKGITATYRMTNKPIPVRHSPYVSSILRPLKAFLEGERALYLSKEAREELLFGTAQGITIRYSEMAVELVNVARKTETSLQRLRQNAQKKGGASADQYEHNISADKICRQLFLDVQEYGRNLATIGVRAEDIPACRSLWECVAPQDRRAVITF